MKKGENGVKYNVNMCKRIQTLLINGLLFDIWLLHLKNILLGELSLHLCVQQIFLTWI